MSDEEWGNQEGSVETDTAHQSGDGPMDVAMGTVRRYVVAPIVGLWKKAALFNLAMSWPGLICIIISTLILLTVSYTLAYVTEHPIKTA